MDKKIAELVGIINEHTQNLQLAKARFKQILEKTLTQDIPKNINTINIVAQVYPDPTGELSYVSQIMAQHAKHKFIFTMEKDFKDLGVRHVQSQARDALARRLEDTIRQHLAVPDPYKIIHTNIEYNKTDPRFIRKITVKTLPIISRDDLKRIISEFLSQTIQRKQDISQDQIEKLIQQLESTGGGGAKASKKKTTGDGAKASKKKTTGGAQKTVKGTETVITAQNSKIPYNTWKYQKQDDDDQANFS